jgi:hypothetical protein
MTSTLARAPRLPNSIRKMFASTRVILNYFYWLTGLELFAFDSRHQRNTCRYKTSPLAQTSSPSHDFRWGATAGAYPSCPCCLPCRQRGHSPPKEFHHPCWILSEEAGAPRRPPAVEVHCHGSSFPSFPSCASYSFYDHRLWLDWSDCEIKKEQMIQFVKQ